MRSRRLGKTSHTVSEIGFGAWAIGGGWGETDDAESLAAMLPDETLQKIGALYREQIAPRVHHRW